jgi:hypothetical protein
MVGVMITNGPGGHPAWKHANVTAAKIVQIDPGAEEGKQAAANRLRGQLEQALVDLHEKQKQHELGRIREQGSQRLGAAMQAHSPIVDEAMAILDNAVKGGPLEEHYSNPEVRRIIRDEVLEREFSTQVYIHRSEHADQNRGDPHARAFMARHHGPWEDIIQARHEHAVSLIPPEESGVNQQQPQQQPDRPENQQSPSRR